MDSIQGFSDRFHNDNECIPLLYRLKWPAGYTCPKCSCTSSYTIKTRRLPIYECRSCGHQASLTSGTVMEKSRTPLHKWLLAMFLVAACENSINAVRLAGLIKVTYKTAWAILNKIRMTLSEADRSVMLSNTVEAKQEIYMKQPIPTFDALQKERTAIIARSTDRQSSHSYFKIKLLQSAQSPRSRLTAKAEEEFMEHHVSRDTDARSVHLAKRHANPPSILAHLSSLAKEAFQWMNDTFHGLSLHRSQAYLDEFCFRINHSCHSKQYAFEHLLQLCLAARTTSASSRWFPVLRKLNPRGQYI